MYTGYTHVYRYTQIITSASPQHDVVFQANPRVVISPKLATELRKRRTAPGFFPPRLMAMEPGLSVHLILVILVGLRTGSPVIMIHDNPQ